MEDTHQDWKHLCVHVACESLDFTEKDESKEYIIFNRFFSYDEMRNKCFYLVFQFCGKKGKDIEENGLCTTLDLFPVGHYGSS